MRSQFAIKASAIVHEHPWNMFSLWCCEVTICCYKIQDLPISAKTCSFKNYCTLKINNNYLNNWKYDYIFFYTFLKEWLTEYMTGVWLLLKVVKLWFLSHLQIPKHSEHFILMSSSSFAGVMTHSRSVKKRKKILEQVHQFWKVYLVAYHSTPSTLISTVFDDS